ncbi:MAG: hypothetical protein R3B53_01180 [Candidatus Paceibacterota bacterium]
MAGGLKTMKMRELVLVSAKKNKKKELTVAEKDYSFSFYQTIKERRNQAASSEAALKLFYIS